jgi:IS5 family transposase
MFKIVLLKRLYNLADEQTEFQINDRLSFKEFLGLSEGDKVPDQKTVWDFQNRLVKKKLDGKLFDGFHKYLDEKGLFVNEGKIVDASFVEVPRQRNTREENRIIKAGRGDELWNDKPHRKSQKDIDARWTKKGEQKYYGYKDHAKIDAKSKLIDTYEVTSAEVHDSKAVKKLLREQDKGQHFFADSAYTGKTITNLLRRLRIKPRIIDRAYRNKPLTDMQKAKNKTKSKTRCRCEHVFGHVTNSMGDFFTRNIGFERVKGVVGLINLTYNICRYEQIVRLDLLPLRS